MDKREKMIILAFDERYEISLPLLLSMPRDFCSLTLYPIMGTLCIVAAPAVIWRIDALFRC